MRKLKHSAEDYRVLIFPDIHVPDHDDKTLRAVERYVEDHKCDEHVYLGDVMDLGIISSHNKGNLRAVSGKQLSKEFDATKKVLDRFLEATKGAKTTYLEGNHEFRMTRYIDAHPEVEGILEVPGQLGLSERNIKWVPSWSTGELYTIGKASFTHGKWTSKNHAAVHADKFGRNIFYGHTHDVMSYPKERYGDNETWVGQSLGCLCNYNQNYLKGSPTKWQQAFGVFHFRPDGFFNYTVTMIFDHAFTSPEGVFYDGKKS